MVQGISNRVGDGPERGTYIKKGNVEQKIPFLSQEVMKQAYASFTPAQQEFLELAVKLHEPSLFTKHKIKNQIDKLAKSIFEDHFSDTKEVYASKLFLLTQAMPKDSKRREMVYHAVLKELEHKRMFQEKLAMIRQTYSHPSQNPRKTCKNFMQDQRFDEAFVYASSHKKVLLRTEDMEAILKPRKGETLSLYRQRTSAYKECCANKRISLAMERLSKQYTIEWAVEEIICGHTTFEKERLGCDKIGVVKALAKRDLDDVKPEILKNFMKNLQKEEIFLVLMRSVFIQDPSDEGKRSNLFSRYIGAFGTQDAIRLLDQMVQKNLISEKEKVNISQSYQLLVGFSGMENQEVAFPKPLQTAQAPASDTGKKMKVFSVHSGGGSSHINIPSSPSREDLSTSAYLQGLFSLFLKYQEDVASGVSQTKGISDDSSASHASDNKTTTMEKLLTEGEKTFLEASAKYLNNPNDNTLMKQIKELSKTVLVKQAGESPEQAKARRDLFVHLLSGTRLEQTYKQEAKKIYDQELPFKEKFALLKQEITAPSRVVGKMKRLVAKNPHKDDQDFQFLQAVSDPKKNTFLHNKDLIPTLLAHRSGESFEEFQERISCYKEELKECSPQMRTQFYDVFDPRGLYLRYWVDTEKDIKKIPVKYLDEEIIKEVGNLEYIKDRLDQGEFASFAHSQNRPFYNALYSMIYEKNKKSEND